MATTRRARSQPEITKQGAKESASQPSVRIGPLRGELALSERYESMEIGLAAPGIPDRLSW